MTGDPQYLNMPLIITFLKSYGRVYLGAKPASREVSDGEGEALPEGVSELVPAASQKAFRDSFVAYFNGASKTLVKGQVVSQISHYWLSLATSRARQEEPRSVYQIRRNLRRPSERL